MAEAIRNAKAELPVSDAVKEALPDEARTLHRLLGSRGDSPACATTRPIRWRWTYWWWTRRRWSTWR